MSFAMVRCVRVRARVRMRVRLCIRVRVLGRICGRCARDCVCERSRGDPSWSLSHGVSHGVTEGRRQTAPPPGAAVEAGAAKVPVPSCVYDFVPPELFHAKLGAWGRLDRDTTGAFLMGTGPSRPALGPDGLRPHGSSWAMTDWALMDLLGP